MGGNLSHIIGLLTFEKGRSAFSWCSFPNRRDLASLGHACARVGHHAIVAAGLVTLSAVGRDVTNEQGHERASYREVDLAACDLKAARLPCVAAVCKA